MGTFFYLPFCWIEEVPAGRAIRRFFYVAIGVKLYVYFFELLRPELLKGFLRCIEIYAGYCGA